MKHARSHLDLDPADLGLAVTVVDDGLVDGLVVGVIGEGVGVRVGQCGAQAHGHESQERLRQ